MLSLESQGLNLDIWALLRALRAEFMALREGRFPLRCLRSAGLQAKLEGLLEKLGVAMVAGRHIKSYFYIFI